jgi:hypothetical protein
MEFGRTDHPDPLNYGTLLNSRGIPCPGESAVDMRWGNGGAGPAKLSDFDRSNSHSRNCAFISPGLG